MATLSLPLLSIIFLTSCIPNNFMIHKKNYKYQIQTKKELTDLELSPKI